VACRTALEARAVNARRRARERQVAKMPHPEVPAPEPQDWRPLLDHELGRLPPKYRLAIILCDLEGRGRKEVAGQLRLPEGTLSSRLARGRRLLAKRLARYGLALSGGALAVALAEGASAAVPAPLLFSTARAAALVAAGQLAAVSTPAAVLARGVLQAMFLTKLKLVIGAVMVAVALGATGLAYRAGGGPAQAQAAPPADKPRSELDALRRENELLKLNLEVVLEKVRAQETELRTLRGRAGEARGAAFSPDGRLLASSSAEGVVRIWDAATGKQLEGEAARKAFRGARDKEEVRRALDAMEKSLKELRRQLEKPEGKP
jgi:hypothetical protein